MNRYGFDWGPMQVTRVAHIEGRGYVVEITTDHARLQIHITEKGRKITSHPLAPYACKDSLGTAEVEAA